MKELKVALSELGALYQELPEVACRGCGLCCVSPTSTLIEFVYLMQHCLVNMERSVLEEMILRPPQLHPDYEGNLRCPFLVSSHCSIHPGRAGGCRVFGIPATAELGIDDFEVCRNEITIISGSGSVEFLRQWLDRLTALNAQLYDFGMEPYYIKGFHLAGWFDIYFDDTLDFEPFATIRQTLIEGCDISFLKSRYVLTSGLREKIDRIAILNMLLDSATPEMLRAELLQIRDGYPFSGTYFFEEANAFLAVLNAVSGTRPCA